MSDHDPFREKKLEHNFVKLPEKPLGQLLIPEAIKMDPLRAESYKVAPYRDLRFPDNGSGPETTTSAAPNQPQAIHTSVFEPVKFPPLEQTLRQEHQRPRSKFFQTPIGKLIALLFGMSTHRQKSGNVQLRNHHVTHRIREQLAKKHSPKKASRS